MTVREGPGGICYLIVGTTAIKANKIFAKFPVLLDSRLDWKNIPKLMILISKVGIKIVVTAETGLL